MLSNFLQKSIIKWCVVVVLEGVEITVCGRLYRKLLRAPLPPLRQLPAIPAGFYVRFYDH